MINKYEVNIFGNTGYLFLVYQLSILGIPVIDFRRAFSPIKETIIRSSALVC